MTVGQCGTQSGYMAHRRRKEPTCAECRRAVNAYNRSRRSRGTARNKIEDMALTREEVMAARQADERMR